MPKKNGHEACRISAGFLLQIMDSHFTWRKSSEALTVVELWKAASSSQPGGVDGTDQDNSI